MTQLRLTQHAIDRFVERHGDGRDREEQAEELFRLAASARSTKQRTLRGEEIWTAEHVSFVVKRDVGCGRAANDSVVVVTVLPARRQPIREVVLAEFNEWSAARDEPAPLTMAEERALLAECHELLEKLWSASRRGAREPEVALFHGFRKRSGRLSRPTDMRLEWQGRYSHWHEWQSGGLRETRQLLAWAVAQIETSKWT